MFQIQILDSQSHLVHQIVLTDKPVFFGRDPSCTVCLPENGISRRHSVIELNGRFYVIKDLGSTNGTWVNKEPVKKQILRAGDIIFIGSYRISVKYQPGGEEEESFADVGKAKLQESAFQFDSSPKSDHTVRLDMDGELARILQSQHILDRLVRLQEISQEISLIETPEFLYNKVLKIILAELKADRASMLIPDSINQLKPVAAFSTVSQDSKQTFDIHQGVIETVVKDRQAILTEDATSDARFNEDTGKAPKAHSVMCVPLLTSKKLQGILYLEKVKNNGTFKEEDLRILAVLGNQVAISLNNARLFQDVLSEKRKIQAVIEHLKEGLVITDSRLRIEKYNEAAAHILAEKNNYLVEKNLKEILEAHSESFDKNAFEEAIEAGGVFQFSLISEGERQVFSASVGLCPSNDGQVPGRIFSFHDMSAFANLGMLKSEFIRIASHKLRTPLTILMGNLELLKMSSGAQITEGGQGPLMIGVEENLEQFQNLVNRFVEFVELDQLSEPFQEVNIEDVISLAWAGLSSRASSKSIILKKSITSDSTFITGISDRLVHCFTNVFENAIKFSPENSSVTVRIEESRKHLLVHVEDEGPGIPRSHLPYIFCGFHQVEEIPTGEAEGVGLGLMIAKRILHLHGATIQANSKQAGNDEGDSGKGTIISVKFIKDKNQIPSTCQLEQDHLLAFS